MRHADLRREAPAVTAAKLTSALLYDTTVWHPVRMVGVCFVVG